MFASTTSGKKRLIFLLFILSFLFSFQTNAQTFRQLVNFADQNYSHGDYYSASLYYKQAIEIDSSDIHVLWKYAECLRLYNNYEEAEIWYSKVYYREQGAVYPLSLFYKAAMQKYNGNYKEAAKNFKLVMKQFSREKKSYYYLKSKQETASCSFAMRTPKKDTTGFRIINMGENINSYDSEFGGAFMDSSLLYSSLRAEKMGENFEIDDPFYNIKIYSSIKKKDSFLLSRVIDTLINSALFHNANGVYNSDRSRFYFSRCDNLSDCKIMYCDITNGMWSTPMEVQGGMNKAGFIYTQPSLAKINDREYLFFSSNMPGGYGNLDIWYSEIQNGVHTRPVNAGTNINSPDDDVTPFYDVTANEFYFSSPWHEGFGGFDVFRSKGLPESLGKPVNVGYPVNTQWNDLYYTTWPAEHFAFVTSNRLGSFYKKSPTCCNDIYILHFPFEAPPEDTIPYQSLVELNKYLPVTLYFHNDEPIPRSNDTTHALNYLTTYDAYSALIEKYKEEYSKGLEGDQSEKAKKDIESFFEDYVNKGVYDLEIFTKLLLTELDKGFEIELTIKGFASPLAKTDYNVHLTKRRIQSLMNYLREYDGGKFIPYMEGTAENGGKLFFVKIPFGEYTASNLVSDNFHDTKNSVYSRSAALERKIEIQTVHRANKDSVLSELKVNKEAHDFGAVKPGSTVSTTFVISNSGKGDLILENVLTGCDCVSVEWPKDPVKPGETAEIKITYNTSGYTGKQVRSVTVVCNGFPPNKRLVLTAEIKP